MTMRTRDRIVCDCGHQGSLCCAENDQPYSSLWESYSLEGFQGRDAVIMNNAERPNRALRAGLGLAGSASSPGCPLTPRKYGTS